MKFSAKLFHLDRSLIQGQTCLFQKFHLPSCFQQRAARKWGRKLVQNSSNFFPGHDNVFWDTFLRQQDFWAAAELTAQRWLHRHFYHPKGHLQTAVTLKCYLTADGCNCSCI